ncbi:MAG: UPF0182 family protein [Mycobacterium sp.]|nr:UPF0182 family protein [Mycobacterium sp.]
MAMRPPLPSLRLSRRARIALWTVAIIIVLIIALIQLSGVYINFAWFDSVGYSGVYTTIFWTRVALFFIFGGLMALIIGGNLVIAYLLSPPFRPMSPEQQNIERYRAFLEPRRIMILVIAVLISLLAAGMSAQGDWATWQLWLHGGSFHQSDPQFGLDISFYAWDYPVYRLLLSFGFSAIIFSIVLSVLVHYLTGAIRLQTPGPKVTVAARRHLTLLVFVFVVLKAIAYWLDRYGLVFSDRSAFTGASYTDVHAVLPARTILFWIALVIAAGLIASLWLRSTLLPGIAFISMLVLSILISGIYPAILQQVSVKPNASTKEIPYIQRNLSATRAAYNINNVDYVNYDATNTPDLLNTQQKNATIDNIRILDPNIVSGAFLRFRQQQNYYGFAPTLDLDRYGAGRSEHDYVVGVRELDAANLTGPQTNWINSHTNFTHGYGFVAANAGVDVTDETQPFASVGAIPSGANDGSFTLNNNEVYYGELMPDYSIVGANGPPQEYNGDGKSKVTYHGGGGVSLGNFFTRLAFAINYKQTNFLLNNAASASGARIIFNRDPRAMVQKVAPFLRVDGDPYPIVDSKTGDITWMIDGYTTMDNYPYSQRNSLGSLTSDSVTAADRVAGQPNDQINYIRNSVKATVDAYTGKVTLYAWDPSDPVLQAWESVFPGLVQPRSSMPGDVRAHVRYPEDLFKVQRTLLGTYHVTDPVAFYNVSQKWTVPTDDTNSTLSANANQPPYYMLAAPPTNDNGPAEFQLTSAMNVNNSTLLAAYLSVDCDPAHYGQITVLQPPRGTSVQGPEQIYNKITTDNTIKRDSLFASGNGSSTIVHGNLLTLPLGKSFLYVEPLYSISSGTGAYPSLQRVIVVYGNKIGYGQTLSAALSDFQLGHHTGQTLGSQLTGNPTTQPPDTQPPSTSPTQPSTGNSTGTPPASKDLRAAERELEQAIASGDKGAIAAALQKILSIGGSALATASPAAPDGSAPASTSHAGAASSTGP